MNTKKMIKRKLINLQNQLGKINGRSAWIRWKEDNGHSTNKSDGSRKEPNF
jgi:hypothetical protein